MSKINGLLIVLTWKDEHGIEARKTITHPEVLAWLKKLPLIGLIAKGLGLRVNDIGPT